LNANSAVPVVPGQTIAVTYRSRGADGGPARPSRIGPAVPLPSALLRAGLDAHVRQGGRREWIRPACREGPEARGGRPVEPAVREPGIPVRCSDLALPGPPVLDDLVMAAADEVPPHDN